jgi:hypothetical protein
VPDRSALQLSAETVDPLAAGYGSPSLGARPGQPPGVASRTFEAPGRRFQRLLEISPGLLTYGLIALPIVLSLSWPQLVAWAVLTFDVYWLYKAVMLTGSTFAAYRRIQSTLSIDWRRRALALADVPARRDELDARIPGVAARVRELHRARRALAAIGGRRELGRLREERAALGRVLAEHAAPMPNPRRIWHVALIPTYTEPYEKLEATVRALADADWPAERKIVAIITRETDAAGRAHVDRLRERFGGEFAQFFHVLDPLEPGVVLGKSSAMAYGGRWLYRELTALGLDPSEVVVTDLDSDYRVHRSYFGYLTWMFLANPDRHRRLYQPVPMFHNNLWQVPMPVRLVAMGATHLQMWRSLTPEKLVSFSSYAVSLRTLHDVDYWATDAIPEDSRFYWKAYFHFRGAFQSVPLFIPVYGDAVRARSYARTLVEQYRQIRRWAWGVTDIAFYVRHALGRPEISRWWRLRRLADLWLDHLNWAIAPFVIIFGSSLPLILNPAFAETTLGQNLPVYASWLLTGAFCCLAVLMHIEERLAPPRPRSWGVARHIASRLQWLLLPVVGLLFSNIPALDAQTRLMTGRYLEYRVTPKD